MRNFSFPFQKTQNHMREEKGKEMKKKVRLRIGADHPIQFTQNLPDISIFIHKNTNFSLTIRYSTVFFHS